MINAPTASAPRLPAGESEPKLLLTRVLSCAARHKLLISGTATLAFAFVAMALFQPRKWTSQSAFIPHASAKLPGNLSGLAAQFGVSLPNVSDATQGPMFYAEMLKSRHLLEQLASSPFEYSVNGKTTKGNLYTIYEMHGTQAEQREEILKTLARDVDATVSIRTGIVRASVSGPDPALAQKMNQRLIDLLSEFNTNTRQSQAGAERKYAQAQLAEAKVALDATEEALERFLQQNASYASSERLKLEAARLQRSVTHRQGIYSALATSYEQARLEEIRDTPQLSIVEPPDMPARPTSRNLFIRAPAALMLGGLIGLLLAGLIDVWRSLPTTDPAGFAALRRDWRGASRSPGNEPTDEA